MTLTQECFSSACAILFMGTLFFSRVFDWLWHFVFDFGEIDPALRGCPAWDPVVPLIRWSDAFSLWGIRYMVESGWSGWDRGDKEGQCLPTSIVFLSEHYQSAYTVHALYISQMGISCTVKRKNPPSLRQRPPPPSKVFLSCLRQCAVHPVSSYSSTAVRWGSFSRERGQ